MDRGFEMSESASVEARRRIVGIGLMAGAFAMFALLDATAKYLVDDLGVGLIVFARYAFSLLFVFYFLFQMAASFLGGAMSDMGALLSSLPDALGDHAFVFALVLVLPMLNGLFLYLMRAPTAEGRPVMDALEGLRLYMETAESGRLNIADAPDLTTAHFEALLPYAVALDVERPWADAFAAALARAHPGDADPMSHYHSRWNRGRAWSSDSFGRSIASSVAGASGALAASMPRSSSGSSGFSGGGGSGRGGGGGGGGGW